jgi:hypothetical protein
MIKLIMFSIFIMLAFLAFCEPSSAESSSYYQLKINGGQDSQILNAGYFHWRFAGLNDHATLTYINSSKLGSITGVDIGGGLWFFDVGAVLGYNNGSNKDPDPHLTIAFYPEIMIPFNGKKDSNRDYFMDFCVRYYATLEGTNLLTFGLGFTWGQ